MPKSICIICKKNRAKRACPIENNALICSTCCVEKRGVHCGECRHYIESEKYAIERFKSTGQHRFDLDMRYENEIYEILQLAEDGKLKNCKKRLEEFAQLIPNSHLLHFALGVVSGMHKNYQQALFYFNRSIEIFPYFAEAWYNKGGTLIKLYDVSGAIKAARMVKRFASSGDEIYRLAKTQLAEIEDSLGASKQTLDGYIKGEEMYNAAFKQLSSGTPKTALEGFKKVLKLNPEHVQSYGNIGLCHAMLGQNDEAIAAFKKAIELDPEYHVARQNMQATLALKPGESLSADQLSEPIEFYKEEHFKKRNCKS